MIIEITKPNKYVDSVSLEKESGFHLFHDGDKTFMQGEGTKEQALAALEAHNPPPPSEPTVEEKLASVGLSIEDLKAALGV
jgi:hypothetical protein